jgi:hypothetical protein
MYFPFSNNLILFLLLAFSAGYGLIGNGNLAAQTMDLHPKQSVAFNSLTALDTARLILPNLATDKNASSTPREIAWVFKVHPFQALLRGSYFLVAERFWNQNKYAASFGLGITRNPNGVLSSVDDYSDPIDAGFPSTSSVNTDIRTGFYSQLTLKRYMKAYRFGPGQGASYVGLHQVLRSYNWTIRGRIRDNNGNPMSYEFKENFFEWQVCPIFGRSWVKSNGFFIDLFVGAGLFVWQGSGISGSSFLNPGWSDTVILPLPRFGMAFGLTRFRD